MLERARSAIFGAVSKRFFYGWMLVGLGTLVIFATGPGQSHLIGLFFDPITAELGLSRTAVALAYGSATLVAAFLLPWMGKLVDRFGPRVMLVWVSLGLGIACLTFSYIGSWLSIAVGFGALRFLAQGSLTLAAFNLVSQWFVSRRGFALGLVALGFPLSMAVHPPLVQLLMESIGWRQVWTWLAVTTWVLLIPFVLLVGRGRPEEVGLQPDGKARQGRGDDGITIVEGLTLAQSLRTRTFYIVAAILSMLSLLVTALHVENKGILTAKGLDPQTATFMFTITGVVAAVSMPIVGHMLDRFRTERMLAAGLLLMVASLLSATLVEDLPTAVAYAVVFGVVNGVGLTYFAFMWPRFFGRKHLGSIQGVGQMITVVGASLGPLPLALAVDYLGDYDHTLRWMALVPLVLVGPAFLAKSELRAG